MLVWGFEVSPPFDPESPDNAQITYTAVVSHETETVQVSCIPKSLSADVSVDIVEAPEPAEPELNPLPYPPPPPPLPVLARWAKKARDARGRRGLLSKVRRDGFLPVCCLFSREPCIGLTVGARWFVADPDVKQGKRCTALYVWWGGCLDAVSSRRFRGAAVPHKPYTESLLGFTVKIMCVT